MGLNEVYMGGGGFGLLSLMLALWSVMGGASQAATPCASNGRLRSGQAVETCPCAVQVSSPEPCSGPWLATLKHAGPVVDHRGLAWTPSDGAEVYGVHCNVSRLHVKQHHTVYIKVWNGSHGGRLVVQASGDILVEGRVDGAGRGYRGGSSSASRSANAFAGEGFNGTHPYSNSQTANGGGGGGVWKSNLPAGQLFVTGRPGAGGGYGSAGDRDMSKQGSFTSAGQPYGSRCVAELYPGAGGGGGGNPTPSPNALSPPGAQGGHGGAAVFLYSTSGRIRVSSSGSISMDGAAGTGDAGNASLICRSGACPAACNASAKCTSLNTTTCYDYAGPGGGGAGGTVFLSSDTVDISGKVTAVGGLGGIGAFMWTGCGGSGGVGRIRIDANRLNGSTTPSPGNSDAFSFCPCNATVPPTTPPASTPEVVSAESTRVTASLTSSSTSTPLLSTDSSPSSAGITVWIVVLIVIAVLLLVNVVVVLAFFFYKRNRGGPKKIHESALNGRGTSSTAILHRMSSTQSLVCMVCRESGMERCMCPKPPGVSNPGYDNFNISFVTPRLTAPHDQQEVLASGGSASTPSGEHRRPSLSSYKSRQSAGLASSPKAVNNYDLVEGGPGTVSSVCATDNPNYELKIPLSAGQRSVPDSTTHNQLESAPYMNLPDVYEGAAPIQTDQAGYLVASSSGVAEHGKRMPSSTGRSPTISDLSRSAMTSAAVSPDGSCIFRFPPSSVVTPQQSNRVSPAAVTATTAGEKPAERCRKDSGIEVEENGCFYAVVPIAEGASLATNGTHPAGSHHIAARPNTPKGSAEHAKNMPPIPEQTSGLGDPSPRSPHPLAVSPPEKVEHQYAHIKDIQLPVALPVASPGSPTSPLQLSPRSDSFSVSAV